MWNLQTLIFLRYTLHIQFFYRKRTNLTGSSIVFQNFDKDHPNGHASDVTGQNIFVKN